MEWGVLGGTPAHQKSGVTQTAVLGATAVMDQETLTLMAAPAVILSVLTAVPPVGRTLAGGQAAGPAETSAVALEGAQTVALGESVGSAVETAATLGDAQATVP